MKYRKQKMNSNEVINSPEQNNNQLAGWEEVAAMADKMPAKEFANNLVGEDNVDGYG